LALRRGGKSRLVINARSEDLEHRPAFKKSFAASRCLVPANGFFEWTKIGRTSQPYYFTSRESPLLGLAGLWSEDTPGRLVYVILTTGANEIVSPIHARMPVILSKNHHADWLRPERLSNSLAQAMFQPWPAADMLSEPVGMGVNDASHDQPNCIRPLEGPVDLFTD
jgi:putative SOS response-associated peptidase YedK